MSSRLVSMDLLKGFTVILMIFINFFDEVALESFLYSPQGRAIDFLVTALVPNVFIFLMGFFLIVAKGFTPYKLFKKALLLLSLGYLINITRYPYMLYLANGSNNFWEYMQANSYYIHMVDVYIFLGYACVLLLPFSFLPKRPASLYLTLTAVIMYLTTQLEKVQNWLDLLPEKFIDFATYLFLPLESNVYFAFLPWLAYLFLGIACGIFYKQKPPQFFFKTLAVSGLILTSCGTSIFLKEYQLATFKMRAYFYQHDYTVGLLLLGICLLMPVIAEYLFTRLPSIIQTLFSFTSKNIIIIYLTSWQIICYLKFVDGWADSLTLLQTIGYTLVIYGCCLLLARLIATLRSFCCS